MLAQQAWNPVFPQQHTHTRHCVHICNPRALWSKDRRIGSFRSWAIVISWTKLCSPDKDTANLRGPSARRLELKAGRRVSGTDKWSLGGIYPYCSHRKTPMMKVTWMNCLQLKESVQKAHAHVWHSPSVWTVSAHRSQRGSQWPTWAIVTFNSKVWNLCEMVAAAAAATVAAAAAAAAAISKHTPSLL